MVGDPSQQAESTLASVVAAVEDGDEEGQHDGNHARELGEDEDGPELAAEIGQACVGAQPGGEETEALG